MPTFFNFNKRKGVFMIPAGATKSPTPAPPSFSNTKSLAFDGVDEYVDCGNISALNGVTEATWMGWFKRDASGSYYLISTWGVTGSTRQFSVIQTPTQLTVFMALGGFGNQRTMFTNTTLTFTTGVWYHLAFVYNEAEVSNADKMKVYINGVLQANQSAGNAINYINPSTASFEIGKLGGYTTNEFNGNIDEVAIFTSALTSEQINTIATAPSDLSIYNPIAWYRNGDGDTFPTIADNGSGGNNGTMINMEAGDIVNDVP